MTKLSPHYLQDSAVDLPADVKRYLEEHYLKHLENWQVPNPKVLVVFSGGNAMGKTTLSRLIGRELKALVLENDAVKRTIMQLKPEADRNERNVLTWQYTMELYKRLSDLTPNGLVVRDGLIDWYFDRILPVFERQGYKLFVVGFDLSKEKQIELIKQRGDTPTVTVDRLMVQLQDHAIHTKRFREKYKVDMMLRDDNLFDHGAVVERLRAVIAAAK